jgi:hypothetical protein
MTIVQEDLLHDPVDVEENLLGRLLQAFPRMFGLARGVPEKRWWCADEQQYEEGYNGECGDPSHEKIDSPSSYLTRVEPSVEHKDAELHQANRHYIEQASCEVCFDHPGHVFGGYVKCCSNR